MNVEEASDEPANAKVNGKSQKAAFAPEELVFLSETDSTVFGFLKLNKSENAQKKSLVLKAVKCLERMLINHFEQKQKSSSATDKKQIDALTEKLSDIRSGDISQDKEHSSDQSNDKVPGTENDPGELKASIFCKLGHFNLILEDYAKALSAYQLYFNLEDDQWKNLSFMYGLGMVYFHYKEFRAAIKTFRHVLYLDPGFCRSNEIHLRLGLMFKILEDYESSHKHFQLVLSSSSPCSLSTAEVNFHIAHLFEVEGKHKSAKEAYEQLLDQKDLPQVLRAEVLKQLGWMHHTIETLGEKAKRQALSVHYLQKSIESDPTNGQSLYFLGRCYANLGKVHDAFVSYRSSVDKAEANADTWCSIGVLYQQQNQPMDALQAYICAVQLDKNHTAAWTNLGLLYENCNQPQDALKCYVNVNAGKGPSNPMLSSRIKILQSQTAGSQAVSNSQRQPKLPCIEDAWNFPIRQEMVSRQNAAAQEQVNRMNPTAHNQRQSYSAVQTPLVPGQGSASQPAPEMLMQVRPSGLGSASTDQPSIKRMKLEATSHKPGVISPDANARPSFYLNQQQLQLLNFFQQNQANLSPQQRSLFQQLQQQYQLMQQHQQQQKLLLQKSQLPTGQPPVTVPTSSPHTLSATTTIPCTNPSIYAAPDSTETIACPTSSVVIVTSSNSVQSSPANVQIRTTNMLGSQVTALNELQTKPSTVQTQQRQLGTVSQLTNTQPTVVLHDLCSEILSDKDLRFLLSRKDVSSSIAEDLLSQLTGDSQSGTLLKKKIEPQEPLESQSDFALSTAFPNKLHSKMIFDNGKSELEEPPKLKSELSAKALSPASLSINMSSSQLLASCRNLGKNGVTNTRIMAELCPPPFPPDPPYPPVSKESLLPPTPSVFLDNKKDAYSPQLQEFCLAHPIAVIRGLTSVLKLDLGLFSTKTLVEANPDHTIEVRTQLMMPSDENWDMEKRKQVWRCESHRSHMSIARYAQYQASSFQESLTEEQGKSADSSNNVTYDSDSDSNSSVSRTKRGKKNGPFKTIKFGTNVDLSDERKWRQQLQELTKLPAFLRVVSAGNMLSHVGHVILGMNTVQLYMKVPGSRTGGHQENNNFCSVNINIGPGECEWFGVDDEYWGVMHKMCERNNINFLHGSWWPLLEDLMAENIPVYRFLQRPGDTVFVNAGCIHWVQAASWCNNIAWNVGPMTAKQYQVAVERYEWNKLQSYKSIVPMARLTWNLARNVKLSDRRLFEQIKYCLLRTLRQCQMTLDFLKELKKEVVWHGIGRNEQAHYCTICEVEVFNILFVKEIEKKKHLVHCLDCSRKLSPALDEFVMLEEYTMEDLMEVYDNFVLHPVPHASI